MRAAFAGAIIGVLVSGAMLVTPSSAQPAPAPDYSRAKELYLAAEAAIKGAQFLDAVRDYEATFDITHDPVLFYKIASANEGAGKCDVALIYYGRYIKEARPSDRYVELTKQHVRACGGDDRSTVFSGEARDGSGAGSGAGSGDGSGAGSGDKSAAGSGAGSGDKSAAGSGSIAGSASAPSGSGAPPPPMARDPLLAVITDPSTTGMITMRTRDKGAWLLVATSIAFVTVGAVLAYSTSSSEADINDLYQGFGGQPSAFDDRTRATYNDLIDEGHRYEKLSWLSFGLAGITAAGATVLFAIRREDKALEVTPTISREGAGVGASLRW